MEIYGVAWRIKGLYPLRNDLDLISLSLVEKSEVKAPV